MEQWYYAVAGQQQGPVDTETLRKLIASGQVGQQDLVWKDGMANWVAPGQVPELAVAPAWQQPQGTPGYGQPQPGFGQAPGYYAPAGYAGPMGQSYQGMATAALVLGILCLCCGVIMGPIAVILGAVAMNGMKKTGNYAGKGMAVAGLVLGICGFVLNAIYIAIRFSMFRL